MSSRPRWGAAVVLLSLVWGVAATADVKEGDVRLTQARSGTPIREKPRALSKAVSTLAYGTRVKVAQVEGFWANVTVEGKTDKGWLRTQDLVVPGALTGAGAFGPSTSAASSSDVSAAGRQFDSKTENTWRRMAPAYEEAYVEVDRLEAQRPSDEEVDAFLKEGLLGGVETEAAPKFASLRLMGASGDEGQATRFEGPTVPVPVPVNDSQFVERLSMNFSPEQEYRLGRAVAAAAITEHGLDSDAKRQAYVRKIGAALVLLADRLRATHGGWCFAVLSSDVPNAIAGPGGFVLVTRGALALARNEEEVAALLAHEIGHAAHKHGEAMVRKTHDFQSALDAIREKLIKPVVGPDGCSICPDVSKLLGESSKGLVKRLNVEGYGRDFELEADWEASLFLCEVGYRASALAEYLESIPEREGASFTTHPPSSIRIDALRPLVYRHACPFEADGGAQARLTRFEKAMGRKAQAPKSESPSALPPGR